MVKTVQIIHFLCKTNFLITISPEHWHGENLYAIWDILTGLPYYGNNFTIVRPYFYTNIPHEQDKQFTEYVDKICAVFLRAERMYGEISVHIEYLP